ncbi:MAG: hypothetical protein JNL75_08560 [Chitinophagales bacterium]|nr:hypothetical protein [Chitinophagales bacterium]
MQDKLDFFVYVIRHLSIVEIDEISIKGKAILTKELVENLSKVKEEIEDIYDSTNSNIGNLEDRIGDNINIELRTGGFPNYFYKFNDFINSQKYQNNLNKFYIKEIDYLSDETSIAPSILENYKTNLLLIEILMFCSDYQKSVSNEIELFFYRFDKGITLKLNYNKEDLENFNIKNSDLISINTQINETEDKKQLFINELINELSKNGSTYKHLIQNWFTIIDNFGKSYRLFISEFSFEKIKSASIEYFQKINDRIYDTLNKLSGYIFGIPIGYIFLLNNFDFKGEHFIKDSALLVLGISFFILVWFIFLNNIENAIKSIELDIQRFKDRIKNDSTLGEIMSEIQNIESIDIKKQKRKLWIIRIVTILILVVTISSYIFIYNCKLVCLYCCYLKLIQNFIS